MVWTVGVKAVEFHVAQLLREPIGSRRVYHVAEQRRGAEGEPVDIEGAVTLLRTDLGVLVTADLETAAGATCSRCLSEFRVPMSPGLEEEYYPTVDVATGAPLPAPEEPTPFLIDEHHILDIDEALRQQLVLEEPMQPLCRPDCAGLCPDCGVDRNARSCGCSSQDMDARWAQLREAGAALNRI